MRLELVGLYCLFLISSPLLLCPERVSDRKWIQTLAQLFPAIPVIELSVFWGGALLQISSTMDGGIMYTGAAAKASPYISPAHVDSPIWYALTRIVLLFGNSRAQYEKFIFNANLAFMAIIIGCFLVGIFLQARKGALLNFGSVLCVIAAGFLPAAHNIELSNTNLLVGGFVAVSLILFCLENRWANFWGGFTLGVGFMIKPNLLLVLIFVFLSGLKDRRFGSLAGIVTAGTVGFLSSLLVPGIGIETYGEFLSKVSKLLFSSNFQVNMWQKNLSIIKYVPMEGKSAISIILILLIIAVEAYSIRRSRDNVLPWFFMTLLPAPILWGEQLAGIYPAIVFLMLQQEPRRQVWISILAVTLVFFSCVGRVPIVVNLMLIGLFLSGFYTKKEQVRHG